MENRKQEQPLSEGVGVLALSLTVHVALAAIVLLGLSWGFQCALLQKHVFLHQWCALPTH